MLKFVNKKSVWISIYYLLLLLLLVSRPEGAAAPNMVVRIAYMMLLIVPGFFIKNTWLPSVMICFITIAQYGFSYSYLPSGIEYYTYPLLLGLFVYKSKELRFKLPKAYYILIILFFFVELIASGSIGATFWGALVALLIANYMEKNKDAEDKLTLAFIVASFTLSLLYILFRDKFLVDYSYSSGLERADWIDPNYFSMAIGMGAIVALSRIYGKDVTLIYKVFLASTVAMSFFSIVLLASRGGLLSFSIASLTIILFSKGNRFVKLLVAVSIVAFTIFLFNSHYFDLVMYRIENDAGGGSGRLDIWISKLQAWGTSGIFETLFGCGLTKGASISGTMIGFHNDFIAMLVEYGIVGFFAFIFLWLFPIWNIIKYKRNVVRVTAFMLFITLECCTLEPLTLGRIPFWMFFIYIIFISNRCRYEKNDM